MHTFPFQVLCRSLHLFGSYQESQVRGLGLREDKDYEETQIRKALREMNIIKIIREERRRLE